MRIEKNAGPDHRPRGRPCDCGVANALHRKQWRPEHVPRGNPCSCGVPNALHRSPSKRNPYPEKRKPPGLTFIGIDGEGVGRIDHKYILLAASTEDGKREWYVQAASGKRLTTGECLDMVLELPTARTKIFSYSFNYDITKIVTDLDDHSIYLLFHPELRKGHYGPKPILWCRSEDCSRDKEGEWHCRCIYGGAQHGEYKLNLQGTKFSVAQGGKRVVIWDLFKFFQSKFVSSLEKWEVGSKEIWDRMSAMKDQRAEFDKLDKQKVIDYCLEETRCMAQLARKLVESHEKVDLKLRSYYGAGSSGAAMLTAMGVRDKISPTPEAMREAVASAFFGGRFEHSVIGSISEPLESADISSAYVYQLAFLPCLQHGVWRHTKKRKDIERAEAQSGALVRYTLGPAEESGRFGKSWGPFPFRDDDGAISFPIESGGGWVWLAEFLAGERIFPHVLFKEAWVYGSNCDCRPFRRIPEYYTHRLKIGKEAAGIVIKLGMNSCYGKLAQSVGNALFQSWIWAGMITSGCRAQLLEVLALHKDAANCLMFATDGVVTREKGLVMPRPLNTRTGLEKPLGGWECKQYPKGLFMARPGIYFPIDPSEEELQQIRARGVGRTVILKSWRHILETWERDGEWGVAKIANVTRFCGAKTSISKSAKGYKRAAGDTAAGKPAYGQWITRGVEMSFDPLPKRDFANPDGTLELRRFPRDLQSVPYSKAVSLKSEEGAELAAAYQEVIEQPDGDLADYELGDIAL